MFILSAGQTCKKILVSDKDYERLVVYQWYISSNGYVQRFEGNGKSRRVIRMHREILRLPRNPGYMGTMVDHISGDKLDNRRENLRIATRAENAINITHLRSDNSSGYPGVSWMSKPRKWRAYISFNRRVIRLGWFKNKKDAIEARNKKALALYGRFVPVCI